MELQTLRDEFEKRKEIAELRRKISELDTENRRSIMPVSAFNFRDVEESLPQFSGEDNYCVRKWICDFEESATVLEWNGKTRYVYAKRLLVGTAKLFLRTISCKAWSELKNALVKKFSKKISSAEIHNRLRTRKKERSESIQRYVLSMQEIASLSGIEEAGLIQDIIDGILGSHQNKMLLYSANSMPDLKFALQRFEKMSIQSSSIEVSIAKERRGVEKGVHQSKNKIKCFNCNELGHFSNSCTKPKRASGSCYKCGKIGHKVYECSSSQSPVMSVQNNHAILDGSDDVRERYTTHFQNEFEFFLRYTFGEDAEDGSKLSYSLSTLVDSGSPISFIQQKHLPPTFINVDSSMDLHTFAE